MRDALNAALLDKKARKALLKARKKEAKARARAKTGGDDPAKRLYVLAFKGDMRASAVKRLGHEIDAVLTVARPGTDEVALRLDSPGGTVTGYGLAAAEILRLRERKITVTALVDQVAASGGYMMAAAGDRIVAAPFAVVGSIGVVAPVPNLHRLLKKNEIDFEEMTAGEWKRSVSVLGEITPAGREHFRGKLDATHGAFKHFVQQCRPNVDIDQVANGDHWLATRGAGLRPRRSALDRRRLSLSRPRERASLRSLDRSAQDPPAADPQRRRRRRAEGGGFRGGAIGLSRHSRRPLRGRIGNRDDWHPPERVIPGFPATGLAGNDKRADCHPCPPLLPPRQLKIPLHSRTFSHGRAPVHLSHAGPQQDLARRQEGSGEHQPLLLSRRQDRRARRQRLGQVDAPAHHGRPRHRIRRRGLRRRGRQGRLPAAGAAARPRRSTCAATPCSASGRSRRSSTATTSWR